MSKQRIQEVIVVEGRYDKNILSQVVDATIVETGGFSVFNDREKLAFLRTLAQKRGIILLTDSDGAGFVIRNYLKGALPRDRVKQAYIPDIPGKERRKRKAGKEGKLGVEGPAPQRRYLRRRDSLPVPGPYHQGGPAGEGAHRPRQRGQAAGPPAGAVAACAPDPQCPAGGSEHFVHTRRI